MTHFYVQIIDPPNFSRRSVVVTQEAGSSKGRKRTRSCQLATSPISNFYNKKETMGPRVKLSYTEVALARWTTVEIDHGRAQLQSSELHTGVNRSPEFNHDWTQLVFSTVVEPVAPASATWWKKAFFFYTGLGTKYISSKVSTSARVKAYAEMEYIDLRRAAGALMTTTNAMDAFVNSNLRHECI